MYLNTVFKYNVFKYCPALIESQFDSKFSNYSESRLIDSQFRVNFTQIFSNYSESRVEF